MKSVTEFPTHKLLMGLKAKTALTTEGKTPEEVQQNIAETFKLEGDKLKYFINAVDVASQNLEKLSRVIVVALNEGESIPTKATKLEEHYYVPEFISDKAPTVVSKADLKKREGGQKKQGGGQKDSPWGISPEQKAAKKAASDKARSLAKAK
ncbi:MAG: hypothetical protein ABL927_07800 [Bdellovibrionales bacterium]|jgi:predicted RNase H-like HicB family nuclease